MNTDTLPAANYFFGVEDNRPLRETIGTHLDRTVAAHPHRDAVIDHAGKFGEVEMREIATQLFDEHARS